ncbi:MAG: precorrin-3B synthase [Acidobacteria bacterium]|nr:precorrin-3B synthase [Acidobacteriota bacterium]MBS1867258.1 precorrin-3B synthase [Acidobacteriota bacterium]
MTEVKETKAQKVERLKREKLAWDHLDEIREFARLGRSSIPPEWAGTYFRTWGIYTQGDGLGVVGGKNGEGSATEYFMVRIRIPNGLLTSEQTRVIANLAEEYGRGVADITTRQNIQLHWVTIEDIPNLIERLRAVGLTTTGACGDVARNVTGCPVAGIDGHELIDASPFALAIDKELGGNREFYNLPRKFKISVTGCSSWCSYPEINDVAFTATTRVRNGVKEVGFAVRIGGGLSTEPHLAVRLNAFIRQEQVVAVARGVAQIFKASEVLRQSRDKARLKYLFLQHGWTAESFLAELERQIGFKLDSLEHEEIPAGVHRDHLGIHRQKQDGLYFVGAPVLRGRIAPTQLRKVAELADSYGDGHVRLTAQQNIVLINIAEAHINRVVNELNAAGLPVSVSAFARGTVACTGSEFCKLALTETKGFARWLSRELEERLPGFEEQIKLHITGCPNSCGQHWIADIGLEGKKTKVNGKLVDAYYFCVGGSVGQFASIARPVGYRCAAIDVPDAIERLLGTFSNERHEAENLRAFLARQSNEEIRTILAGELTGAVARDLPSASVPQGVEG